MAVQTQGILKMSYVQFSTLNPNQTMVRFMYTVHNKFFAVRQVKRSDAHGLFECFKAAMEFVGVNDWEEKLIGLRCDGANVNIAARGLRGYLEEAVP